MARKKTSDSSGGKTGATKKPVVNVPRTRAQIFGALQKLADGNRKVSKHKMKVIIALLINHPDGTQLSGRAGSVVHQRNGVRRNYVTPRLVQNGYTQPVRVRLGLLSAGWRALTQTEQDAWINLSGIFKSNRFGVPRPVKGKAAFVELNTNLINVGGTVITTPNPLADVPSITSATVVSDVSSATVTATYATTPTDIGVIHLVFATPLLSSGVNRPRPSDFRQIGQIPANTASPYLGFADWTAKFGALIAGQKLFLKFIAINTTTGQASPALVTLPATVTP